MNESKIPQPLEELRQHWYQTSITGMPGFDWLGQHVTGEWLVEQVRLERQHLSSIFNSDQKQNSQLIVGIAVPDGIENLVLGVALALEGIAQAILPVTASVTEQRQLTHRYGLTHCIAAKGLINLDDWLPYGPSAQGLECFKRLETRDNQNLSNAEVVPKNILFVGATSGTTTGKPGLFYRDLKTVREWIIQRHWVPQLLLKKPLITPSMQHWSDRIRKILRLLRGHSFVIRYAERPLAEMPISEDCDGSLSPPSTLRRQLSRGDFQHCPHGFLIISSSDHVPRSLRKSIASIKDISLGISYATSQTGPLTWLPPEALLDETDSVGWLLNHVTLDPLNNSDGFERDGLRFREALIKTPSRTLNPGDLLAISSSDQIIFGGRSNDVFLYNSNLISPAEIEEVIYSHPGIQECAAFGASSARFGGVPMAAVTAHPGWSSDQVIQEVDSLCREALGFRRPHRFIEMQNIPKGSTGKVLRRDLRSQYALKQ